MPRCLTNRHVVGQYVPMTEPPAPTDHRTRLRHRPLLLFLVVAVVGFGLAQLVPLGVTNPSARVEPAWNSPETRRLAVAACFDCHSNQSRHVWYEEVAPVKWWIANHVSEGRQAVNFDEWNRPQPRAVRSSRTVADTSMPPSYYHWFGLHSTAKLSAADRHTLMAGLDETIAKSPPPAGRSSGD